MLPWNYLGEIMGEARSARTTATAKFVVHENICNLK